MACWEDASRIYTGHTAHKLSILRCLVRNLLRRETTAKRKQAGWKDGFLLKVLSN